MLDSLCGLHVLNKLMLKDRSYPHIDLDSLVHRSLTLTAVAALRLSVLVVVLAVHLRDSGNAHLRLLMGHHQIVGVVGRIDREMTWW